MDVGLRDQVLDVPVAIPAGRPGQGGQVGSRPPGDGGRTRFSPRADLAFHHEHGPGDRPAMIHLADDVVTAQLDVVEELLAELRPVVDLPEHLHRDARLVDLDREPGQAPVLRDVPVRPGQAQAPVGVVRAARPDLGSPQEPPIAIADGTSADTSQVGACVRLREELDPEFLAGQHLRDVPGQELGRCVRQHGRDADPPRRPAQDAELGDPEVPRRVIEGLLVRAAQALATVFLGPGDPGVTALEQHPLQGPLPPVTLR